MAPELALGYEETDYLPNMPGAENAFGKRAFRGDNMLVFGLDGALRILKTPINQDPLRTPEEEVNSLNTLTTDKSLERFYPKETRGWTGHDRKGQERFYAFQNRVPVRPESQYLFGKGGNETELRNPTTRTAVTGLITNVRSLLGSNKTVPDLTRRNGVVIINSLPVILTVASVGKEHAETREKIAQLLKDLQTMISQ